MRQLSILIPVLVLWLVAAPASAQRYAYGMNTRVLDARMADKMNELGAGLVRVVFGWDVVEPNCKGCYYWDTVDHWRDEARRTNRAIFATLAYSPAWANGNHPYTYPPLDQQDWYDYVFTVVSRYRNDIYLWGVWNEPNLNGYLLNGDLATYEALVRTAAAAIRAANPDANVLGPDVSWHGVRDGWYAAAMSSVGDLFDIVTVHWYPDGPNLEYMMDELVRPYAGFKSVWLTETALKPCASIFGETGQALFFSRVLNAFEKRRGWWTAVFFYDLWEIPEPNDCGSAITRLDWSNRPAFSLYQAFIEAHP